MTISEEEILKIAHLARINIEDNEVPSYQQKLNGVFDLIERLNQFNTESIKPMSHPLQDMEQRLRADIVCEPNQRDYIQKTTQSRVEAGLYLVEEFTVKE